MSDTDLSITRRAHARTATRSVSTRELTRGIPFESTDPDYELNFLASTLDALSAHVAIINSEGTILAANGAWRRFAEINGGDASGFYVGDNYLSVCSDATEDCGTDGLDMNTGIREVIQGERERFYMQYECHTPEGKGWYQVRVTPFDGRSDRFVIAHENITEAKLIEEELRASQSQLAHLVRLGTMGELAAGIAHELNQPLSAIANYASGSTRRIDAEPGSATPEIASALVEVASQAERAGQIIRRLRNFVRRTEPHAAEIHLPDAVKEAVGLLESDARVRGVSIEMSVDGDHLYVSGDAIQLQQVLLNLVRNAVEAIDTDDQRTHGHVAVHLSQHEFHHVLIEVLDDGPGLPEGFVERVFEPFFTTKSSGLGLGLSLSTSIIDAHGGSLRCRNRAEGGAAFQIRLPRSAPPLEDANRVREASP
ncbi:MAG: ATP-binding protein [Planctomycetota bacterium]